MAKQDGMDLRGIALSLLMALQPVSALASGEIGDHVKDLKAHVPEYSEEVADFNERVNGLVERYAGKGADGVDTGRLAEWWEEVKFHAAIEVHHVPVYASIWQGIYGVKESIENGKPVAEVRTQQRALERAMWQGIGAVKLAAKNQASGDRDSGTDSGQASDGDPIGRIITNLEKVTVEHAEGETGEATELVHSTYLNIFEGIEGALIEQDAELVEDLEKDFNVVFPKLLEKGAAVSEVTDRVDTMKDKLQRAGQLLDKSKQGQQDVF